MHHRFGLGEYRGDQDRTLVLAQRLAQLQLDLHDEWAGLMPRSVDVAGFRQSALTRES